MSRDNPYLKLVPQQLKITKVAEGSGAHFSQFGYEFDTSWGDVASNKPISKWIRIGFKSGIVMVLVGPDEALDRTAIFKEGAKSVGKDPTAIWGKDLVTSNAAFVSRELDVTPDQISIRTPGRNATINMLLLTMKIMDAQGAETGLYKFESHGFRYFQRGNPAISEKVFVTAFDPDDREITFWFVDQKGGAGKIRQEDINRILESLHRTTASTK